MKRLFLLFISCLLLFPLFAISDIELFMLDSDTNELNTFMKIQDEKVTFYSYDEQGPDLSYGYIKDGRIYDSDFEETIITITESENEITLNVEDENYSVLTKFNKENGICILLSRKIDEKLDSEVFYDSKTGALVKYKYYIDGKIFFESYVDNTIQKESKCIRYDTDGNVLFTEFYEYPSPNKDITKVYDNNNELDYITETLYTDDLSFTLKETSVDINGVLIAEILYDGKSENPYKEIYYDEKGKIQEEYLCDSERNCYLSLISYDESGVKTEYKFLQFNQDDEYEFNKNVWLSTSTVSYGLMKEYEETSKSDYVNWNEYYYALVTKCDFNFSNPLYIFLKFIKDEKYLIQSDTLCIFDNRNDYFYCFDVVDYIVDFDSCYKVKLIQKPSMK